MDNLSTQEWVFIIGAVIGLFVVLFWNRDRIKSIGRGGKDGGSNQKRR